MSPSYLDHRLSPPGLSDLVRSVWSLDYDALTGSLPGTIAPDGQVEFVFQLGAACAVSNAVNGRSDTPRAMIFALRHGAMRMEPLGGNRMVAFRVAPAVASVVLRQPLRDLWDRPVALSDLIGAEADRLIDRLTTAPRHAIGEIIGTWLVQRLCDWDADDARNLQLQGALSRFAGEPVSMLADQLGLTDRTLRRNCERYAGLSPKQLVMSGRMLRACGLLRHGSATPIADVAYRLGFSDQSAFTNAFRHYVGMTPAKLRAELLVFCEAP
jgi:AraC-like DNA-binding protein